MTRQSPPPAGEPRRADVSQGKKSAARKQASGPRLPLAIRRQAGFDWLVQALDDWTAARRAYFETANDDPAKSKREAEWDSAGHTLGHAVSRYLDRDLVRCDAIIEDAALRRAAAAPPESVAPVDDDPMHAKPYGVGLHLPADGV